MPALWQTAAEIGLPVFPCLPNKRPACPHGFKDATTDPRKIREMFLAYPASTLIGVPTGERTAFDVLDLDTAKHPTEVCNWLATNRALIPATKAHKTESGGVHYLFSHHQNLRSWTGKPYVGIDGRADGGYVIWWPATGRAANKKPISAWPSELLQQWLSARPIKPLPRCIAKPSEPRLERLLQKVATAANGERNNLLFWASCRIGEWIKLGELPQEAGESALLYAARYVGLPDREAIATIYSAFERTS